MDECSTVTCGPYAHCEIRFDDTIGANVSVNTAECVCDNGFEGDPTPDIRCVKVKFAFQCSNLSVFLKICDAGYQPIGYECQNINECVLGMHNCSSNGYCTDTQGQWILECFENLTSIKSY